MQLTTLVLLTHLGSAPTYLAEVRPATASPSVDRSGAEDEDLSEEAQQQSEEMEELRAAEEVALNPSTKPNADLLQAVRRLGAVNPLREQIAENFSEPDQTGGPMGFELPPVTDLASLDLTQLKGQYDIPIEMQPLVAQYVQFFQGAGRKWFRRWMSRSTRFIPMMQAILETRGLPKDTVYLAMIESGFSPQAYSWARAAGPWQFIASTARLYGLRQDFWVDERRDPSKATEAAARYLLQLHQSLGSWYLAWAAYNAGGRKLERMIARKGTTDFWELSEGRGLAKETKHYVPKLIACALVAKYPKAFGFSDEEFDFLSPYETEEVALTEAADLEVVARAAEVDLDEIRELNPELKRWCTPPATNAKPYILRLPKGSAEKFTENFAKIAPRERLAFRIHHVKRGDTLSRIAADYHSAPEAILRMNGLRNLRRLRVNSELVIPVPNAAVVARGRADTTFERQVTRARRGGFVPIRPDLEIPAGTPPKIQPAITEVKTEVIGGKTRIEYGVQSGDTLWAISQRFSCSVDSIRKWNHLPRRARGLQVGTVLIIWSQTPS
jgi:membrane-bound lytic murein transglycosylase D